MPSHPHINPNPFSDLSDADLLALVEGLPLSADRADVARLAIARDPRLGLLLAQFRADREELSSLAAVRAPADLLERVELQLEREALVGLARSEASVSADIIPISRIVPRSTPIAQRAWFKLTAAAAAVAIGVGGGLLIMQSVRHDRAARELALTLQPPVLNPVNPMLLEPGPGEIAVTAAGKTDAVTTVAALPPASTPDVPARPVISVARALELAEQGRLLIRIRAAHPEQAIARLDNLANRRMDTLAVARLSPPSYTVASAGLLEAERRARQPLVPVSLASSHPRVPFMAGSRSPLPLNVPLAEPSPTLANVGPRLAIEPTGFAISVQASHDSLDSLRRALSGEAFTAEFTELPAPLPIELATDAESVLWWLNPVTSWGHRVGLTVLVEQK